MIQSDLHQIMIWICPSLVFTLCFHCFGCTRTQHCDKIKQNKFSVSFILLLLRMKPHEHCVCCFQRCAIDHQRTTRKPWNTSIPMYPSISPDNNTSHSTKNWTSVRHPPTQLFTTRSSRVYQGNPLKLISEMPNSPSKTLLFALLSNLPGSHTSLL